MALKNYQRIIVTAVPVIIVGLIAYYFSDIVSYLVIGWVLSMIGAPLHQWLSRIVGRSLAALMTLGSFIVIFLMLIWIFIPPVAQQARNLSQLNYENIFAGLSEPIADVEKWLVSRGIIESFAADSSAVVVMDDPLDHIRVLRLDTLHNVQDSLITQINFVVQINNPDKTPAVNAEKPLHLIDRLRENLMRIINPADISGVFGSILGGVSSILVGLVSALFIAFFFLKEEGLFTNTVRSIAPNESEEKWLHALSESESMLKRYFIGILIQILTVGTFVSLTLSYLGFKNALLIGLFAAMMNVIPYVGPILGVSFAILITITANLDVSFYDVILPKMGILVVVFAVMQTLDNFILQPNIFSKSVKAHPLEIFLIVLIGAKLGGILGMVLAIPVYTVLRVLAKVFFSEFKIVQRLTGSL
jgi:predicted PurR-regulated permease PerM